MPPSAKNRRVTKPSLSLSLPSSSSSSQPQSKPQSQPQSQARSSSRSRSGLLLSKWHQEKVAREDALSSSKSINLPLVERTNALPLHQFIEHYVPPGQLQLTALKDTKRTEPSASAATAAASKDTENILEQQQAGSNAGTSPNTDNNDIQYTLDIHSAESIAESDFEACFSLIELTSSEDYRNSSIGWSPSKKRKEMRLPDMRYILLRKLTGATSDPNINDEEKTDQQDQKHHQHRQQRQPVIGFLSFMVTYEDGKEVIYCYEVHLHPTTQGRGLGRQLLTLFEDIGRRVGLEKAMLTVFKANTTALRFYERLGYDVDEYSPQPKRLRNGTVKEADYLILSKRLHT